jgi:hypothetical protein
MCHKQTLRLKTFETRIKDVVYIEKLSIKK